MKELRSSLLNPALRVDSARDITLAFTFTNLAPSGTVFTCNLPNQGPGTTTINYYNSLGSTDLNIKLFNSTSVGASSITTQVASFTASALTTTTVSVTGLYLGEVVYATATNLSTINEF